ncbi:MAG: insulinase family protein [Burkholderiaceae bacterium]|nr:insulinase family protein [Burkholderiaceae bacterium]
MIRRRGVLAATAALSGVVPAAARAAEGVSLPPLALSDRRLANGLRVVGLPVAGAGTVAVQVWYRVGGKDDPPGRSGFAHLFEHLMFKRTAKLPDEAFDRLTEDVGGANNAFTAADVTVYTNDVPANHLERLLWAEAERMQNLRVDAGNFASERDVVKEELRERVEADPYGRLFEALPGLAYQRHPYKRPVIGRIADLDAATLADVQRFHATFYRPDNAVLIVAGGFDPADLDRWVDRHFGPLITPRAPIPRVTVTEPRRSEGRRVRLHAPIVPLPAVALLWQGPRAGAADAPALQVASALLSQGDSARLAETLVYRDQLAQSAGFWADLNADAGMLAAYAVAAGGRTPEAVEKALQAELKRLATQPIGDAELDKVRTQLLTAVVAGRQSPAGLADAAGWAIVNHGDPREAEAEVARLQAVTAADVQRVLRRHVLERPVVAVHYSAAMDKKAGKAAGKAGQ